MMHNVQIALLVSLLVNCIGQQPSAAQSYSVVELPTPSEGISVARGLNSAGHVAGRSGTHFNTETRAYISTGDNRFQILQTLPGGDYSGAFDINDADQVIGSSNTTIALQAFLWSPSAGMRSLGALAGDTGSQAFGINNRGDIVGYSTGPTGVHACLWASDSPRNLGTLPGGQSSMALNISDSGHIVGSGDTSSGVHAFLWTENAGMLDLGALPGDSNSEAVAVNNSGKVVGFSNGPGGNTAFLWTETTRMNSLGKLPGGNFSRALGINNSGQIVGVSTTAQGYRAVIWTDTARIQDLNSLIPVNSGIVLFEAHAINNRGQILAYGVHQQNSDPNIHASPSHIMDQHGIRGVFLLTPAAAR